MDPPVEFGKYKHEGWKLSDLPLDYLSWLATGHKENGPIIYRGWNWELLARLELARRNGGRLSTGVAYDDAHKKIPLDQLSDQEIFPGRAVNEVEIPKIPDNPSKSELPDVTKDAMNSVAFFFLKEFITRSNKNQTLSHFTAELGREAVRLAENKQTMTMTGTNVKLHVYNYLGFYFGFMWAPERKKFELRAILDRAHYKELVKGELVAQAGR